MKNKIRQVECEAPTYVSLQIVGVGVPGNQRTRLAMVVDGNGQDICALFDEKQLEKFILALQDAAIEYKLENPQDNV